MIDYITGTIAELTPTAVVIDNHGIGYMMNITLVTYDRLLTVKAGEVVKLWVSEVIREDTHDLNGFASKREREMHELLISVSGVGPGTARAILSTLKPDQLEQAIAGDDVTLLKGVKGVGGKTAQRIIVDLKDKINSASSTLNISNAGGEGAAHAGQVMDEALAALIMLGFTQQQAYKALKAVIEASPTVTVEQAIKQALKSMK